MNSGSVLVAINCTQEKKSCAPRCSQEKGTGALLFSGEGNRCSTVFRRGKKCTSVLKEKENGALLFSRRRKLVHYCYQEETSVLQFSGDGNWYTTVPRRRKLVYYCSHVEGNRCSTVFRRVGEGNWSSIDLRRRKLVLNCFEEKGTSALSTDLRRKNWCNTSLTRRELVKYCSQEKETGAIMLLGVEMGTLNRCTTVIRRRDMVLFCSQEKETGALLSSRRRKLVFYCSCFDQEKGTGAA